MVLIRPETIEDRIAVRSVNDAAFGQTNESALIDLIRAGDAPYISFVAVRHESVVGHILFTAVSVEPSRTEVRIAGLGPMSVRPEVQRQGIGTRLVEAGLIECSRVGYDAVVVLGHPEYYPRFGFIPASRYGLRCEYSVPDDVFMALELKDGALAGCCGVIKYLPPFDGV
jgi:putative acetyltransferase